MKALVTGASGFLGSHIVERLTACGTDVRCLVRQTSQTDYLSSLGVELVTGDVTDARSLPAALEGVEVVYHAAAMVGDWGPWTQFKSVTINGTRNMLKAATAAGVSRFLHVSTDGVYRYKDLAKGVTEDTPMETKFGWMDYYRRSKTEAERIARRFHNAGRVQVSIVRPALILGERDNAMLPGLIAFLKSRSAVIIGSGDNQLPCVYAGDVADLCIRAATTEAAAGAAYNAVNDNYVTQRDLYDAVAEVTSCEVPKRSLPLRAVYALAYAMEARARLRGWDQRPDLTRFSLNLIGLDYVEDPTKAITSLGWRPEVGMKEAVRRSVEWSRSSRAQFVSG